MLKVAEQFSRFPAGRYFDDGPYSGQAFRENLLVPALKANNGVDEVEVNLDGVMGYGSSFLEEAFGGLIRESGFSRDELKKRLRIVSKKASLVAEVQTYINEAE